MDGMKKHAKVRQESNMWYAFWMCPNVYGNGFVPLKATHTHMRPSRIGCLFRREYAYHHINNERSKKWAK